LSWAKLKSSEWEEFWAGSVLGEKSGFWNGSRATKALVVRTQVITYEGQILTTTNTLSLFHLTEPA